MKIVWKTNKEENGKKRPRYKSIFANPNLPFESAEEIGKQDNSVDSDSKHLAESFESEGIQLAEVEVQNGRFNEALAKWETAITLTPDKGKIAWITLGRAQLNFGEPDMAIDSFDKALVLKPDHEEAKADRKSASHLVRQRKQLHLSGLSIEERRFRVQDPDGSPNSS
ncbi:hypothetical protein HPP92_015516 [Vanilla planifolia]|uniref:Tetratricopeptide repeat protein 33 n=1 Tax=Vanilla planifolia TaxID=51239 RepID=A0A835QI66_VANPL|nr:hypothetical protein HPP92_015516 [Vanilla planifolia]